MIRILWLPAEATRARLALAPVPYLAVDLPGAARTITDADGRTHAVDVPPLALILRDAHVPGSSRYELVAELVAELDGQYVPYRLANVHDDGRVCFGGAGSPRSPRAAWTAFWSSPFNRDLWCEGQTHAEECPDAEVAHTCYDDCSCEIRHDCGESHEHECCSLGDCDRVCADEPHGSGGHPSVGLLEWLPEVVYGDDGSGCYASQDAYRMGRLSRTAAGRVTLRSSAAEPGVAVTLQYGSRCLHCEARCECDRSCPCCAEECDCHTDSSCPCREGDCDCREECACAAGYCDCRVKCRCDLPALWRDHLRTYAPGEPGPENDGVYVRPVARVFPTATTTEARGGPGGPEAVILLAGPDTERAPAAWRRVDPETRESWVLAFARREPGGAWLAWRDERAGVRTVVPVDLTPAPETVPQEVTRDLPF